MDQSTSDYIDSLQQKGRYSFAKSELRRALSGKSDTAVKFSLERLVSKGRILMIREGFYIIVPLEYSSKGALPPEWFIDDLMRFIGQPYYVGLLSAAMVHGAAHQQPQEFQVIVPKAGRSINRDSIRIIFCKKAGMESSPVIESKTSTGYMRVSNPAVTALDLVTYANRVGGLDRVLTVLKELKETITPEMLVEAAKLERKLSTVQRLGWLLDRTGEDERVWKLSHWLMDKRPRETPLDPSLSKTGSIRDSRWKVIVNTEVEADL